MTQEQREALVLNNMDIAERSARSLGRLFFSVPLDDLRSFAHIGLVTAANKYDPCRGTVFPAYALKWVRGMIVEEARKWLNALRKPESDGRERSPHIDTAAMDCRALLALLTAKERQVVEMTALAGYTLQEAGRALNVTEGRACQIRTAAIAGLRRRV